MNKLRKVGSNLDRNSLIAPTSSVNRAVRRRYLALAATVCVTSHPNNFSETQVSGNTLGVENKTWGTLRTPGSLAPGLRNGDDLALMM